MGLRRASGPRRHTSPAARVRAALRGRVRWAITAVVLAALPALSVVLLAEDTAPNRITAQYVRTDMWTTGFSGQYLLRNTGDETTSGWTLRFRLPPGSEITSLWNGRIERDGSRYTVREQEWNRHLRPGESAVIGFDVRRVDPAAQPAAQPVECSINGRTCGTDPGVTPAAEDDDATPGYGQAPAAAAVPTPARTGATRDPRPTPSTAPAPPAASTPGPPGAPPATNTPGYVPTPPPGGDTRTRTPVRPYVDLAAPGSYDLAGAMRVTGVTDWILAFVVDGGDCRPSWGGGVRLDDPAVLQRFAELRALGGKATVSFGGAAGNDLAATCATPEALAAAYRQVLDHYRVDRIDLDVEGRSLGRPDIVDRRNQALRLLRDGLTRDGRTLELTYTLPVLPTGLGSEALALLQDAAARGVDVDHVNVLAMDYGPANAPDPRGMMGRHAIEAARSAHAQIRTVWPRLTAAQAWTMLSVTPMIGADDVPGEVFTLADAGELARFAAEQHLGRISWWSATRDRACPQATTGAEPTCSGVAQEPYAYLRAFVS